jgi:hypothetical protein
MATSANIFMAYVCHSARMLPLTLTLTSVSTSVSTNNNYYSLIYLAQPDTSDEGMSQSVTISIQSTTETGIATII